MFAFLKNNKKPAKLIINGAEVTEVQKNETILTAALRANVTFPHSCRVGGCAACKCKLTEGRVKELTESAYILSSEELAGGYILACQAVPKGDVTIELAVDETMAQFKAQELTGEVVTQEKLTHDITKLEVQLAESLAYGAGQFARITLPALSSVARSYSFAAPVSTDNKVSFYIKHVPGGAFSTIVQEQDLLGQKVEVDGPYGDFYLREAEVPFVCIAGGSGLAPVKALLEKALEDGIKRDVVFLFGARTEADLYCLAEINEIKEKWLGKFEFIPVLSDEPTSSAWQGKTGYITEHLAQYLIGTEQAYLCGPPAMIDSSVDVLKRHGITGPSIFFDKFISDADSAAA